VDSYVDKLSIRAFVYAIRNQKSNCEHDWSRAFRRVFLLLFLLIITTENDNIDYVPGEWCDCGLGVFGIFVWRWVFFRGIVTAAQIRAAVLVQYSVSTRVLVRYRVIG